MAPTSETDTLSVLHRCTVAPASDAAEQRLPLTYFDMFWIYFHPIQRLLFYRHPCSTTHFLDNIVPILKTSLSQTLRHYLPLAGNLYYPLDSGVPDLRYFSGDSVTVTFAESTETAKFSYLIGDDARDADDFHRFVPDLPESRIDTESGYKTFPLLAIQVTLFPDTGIAVGVTNHHIAGDASSIVGFIKAWSSVAKLGGGDEHLAETNALPFFDRSVIKDTTGRMDIYWNQMRAIKLGDSKLTTPTNKFRATFVLQKSDIEKLKNKVMERERGTIHHLSSFTVTSAYFWACIDQSAAEAGEVIGDDEEEFYGFAVDARSRQEPAVPAAYFGNCLAFVVAQSTHGAHPSHVNSTLHSLPSLKLLRSNFMEGTLFPNRPAFPTQPAKPASHRLKFNTSSLPLPPSLPQQQQSSTSSHPFPLDSLLQHLLHVSCPVKSSVASSHVVPSRNQKSLSAHFRKDAGGSSIAIPLIGDSSVRDGGSLDFLPLKCKLILDSILELPVSGLRPFFDSVRTELLQEVDLISLLKGLDVSGNGERAILLFEWVVLNLDVCNSDRLDNQIIELMVKILGRESQHSVTSKLFHVIPVEDFTLDVRAWTTILHAYSRSGKYEKAIALFDFIKLRELNPTLVTYNVMLDVYGKKGRSWDKILDLLDEMRSLGLEFDEFTCSTVISACGREGLLEEAKSFFDGLKLNGYVPRTVTYNSLLQVYGKAGIYNEALSVLREMEENNCPPDSVTYNEIVAAYVRAGFHEEGAALIGTMTSKGIMPNAVTYTTVIDAYGKAAKEDKALSLFKQMKELGCVPNVCTYNSIIGMLGKKSRIEEMMEIISDMKSSGCTPNRVTWNTMLAMCGTKGMHKHVNRVFQEMKKCGFEPDRDTFNTLISAYGRCGSEINAGKMYNEMIQAGFSPCITTYNALLNALARKGDWRAAESIVLDMRKKGFRPNETTYSLMLHSHSKGGNIRGIERIAKDIYDGHIFPSWVLLRTLILANFKCKSLVGMERAFQEFLKNGYKPDLVVFNSMVSIFARNKMCDRAHEMLHLIRESGMQPDLVTYNSLMDMYARSGDCWKAQEVLNGLLQGEGKPDLVSYNTVIKGFCRQGLMEEAMKTYSEMTTRGIRPCIVTYNTFIAGFSARGLFQEVDEVISYMIQHNCRPNELTYNTIVDGYCKARRYKDAMDFVARIREEDTTYSEHALQRLVSRVRDKMES